MWKILLNSYLHRRSFQNQRSGQEQIAWYKWRRAWIDQCNDMGGIAMAQKEKYAPKNNHAGR